MEIEEYLKEQLSNALKSIGVPVSDSLEILLERPKLAEHGDLSTNIAMTLASKLRKNPRNIAHDILKKLDLDSNFIANAEVAGGGFINFYFSNTYFQNALSNILEAGENYGRGKWGAAKKIQIEFVSANPTGPLNVVSARAATVGDVLANLFEAVGFKSHKEYYINDAGRQVRLLGMSVSARYMEQLGKEEPFPEDGYHGDYVRDLAEAIITEQGDQFAHLDVETRSQQFSSLALEKIVARQKTVLENFQVKYDSWFRESCLREKNAHIDVLNLFSQRDLLYEKEGAKWFKSSEFGDVKDRVLVTSDGEPTYFLVDIAYHIDKYERGFDMLYDLWGPDHHGYIDRMKAALVALGYPKGSFDVKIIQQVNLLQDGKIIKMSKRAGKIIEMAELIQEVGVDVARFFFLARRNQSPLDFDLDLAKNTSEENPVFYVQYAHARICNIIKHAEEKGFTIPHNANLNILTENEEINLIKKLLEYPEVITHAAKFLEPHRLPNYLQELAGYFHRFYHNHRVVTDNKELTRARLILIASTRIVLGNALKILGIHAPERM